MQHIATRTCDSHSFPPALFWIRTAPRMARARRCIVPSAIAYMARVIPVKRMVGATLALFDTAVTLPQRGLQTTHRRNRPDDCGAAMEDTLSGIGAESRAPSAPASPLGRSVYARPRVTSLG